VVTPLGAGRFACEVVRRQSKWERSNSPTDACLRSCPGAGFADVGIRQVEIGSNEAPLTSDILPPP
jgi:hypothetical protein